MTVIGVDEPDCLVVIMDAWCIEFALEGAQEDSTL